MFYIERDNKILLKEANKEILAKTLEFMPQFKDKSGNLPEIKETTRNIILVDNEFRFEDEVGDRIAKIKTERIAKLKMTPRDFLLALIDMGVDFNQVETLINSNPRVKIELNYCNHIYRGNPLLDQLAPQFNITKEQLDSLFKERGN